MKKDIILRSLMKMLLWCGLLMFVFVSVTICAAEENNAVWTEITWQQNAKNAVEMSSRDLRSVLHTNNQDVPVLVRGQDAFTDGQIIYMLPNGDVYMNMTRLSHESFRNELLYATDLNGNIFYGMGYEDNMRFSTSVQSDQAINGWDITGYIPIMIDDTVRMKNIEFFSFSQNSRAMFVFFDSEKNYITCSSTYANIGEMSDVWNAVADDLGQLVEFTIPSNYSQTIAYIRIVAKDLNELSAVTVNQPLDDLYEAANWYKIGTIAVPEEVIQSTVSQDFTPVTDEILPSTSIVSDATETTEAVQQVQATVSQQETLPDYWLKHVENKTAQIRRLMGTVGRNKSSFLWYTDAHWNLNKMFSPALLTYLYENTPINKVNFGGDIVYNEPTLETLGDETIMAYLWDWRQAVRGLPHHHSVVGNHDDGNATNNILSANYVYSYLMAPEECNDIVRGGDFYYYIDDVNERTRYIYLDTAFENILYDLAQQEWLMEVLISTPAGWHIIPIAHIWTTVDYDQVPPVATGFSYGGETAIYMFDAYNAREAEFADCLGRVEFCIGGHAHTDAVFRSSTGIPVIITEPDCIDSRSGITVKSGTIDENAVSAVIADYDAGVVHVVRVGRGADMEVTLN